MIQMSSSYGSKPMDLHVRRIWLRPCFSDSLSALPFSSRVTSSGNGCAATTIGSQQMSGSMRPKSMRPKKDQHPTPPRPRHAGASLTRSPIATCLPKPSSICSKSGWSPTPPSRSKRQPKASSSCESASSVSHGSWIRSRSRSRSDTTTSARSMVISGVGSPVMLRPIPSTEQIDSSSSSCKSGTMTAPEICVSPGSSISDPNSFANFESGSRHSRVLQEDRDSPVCADP